MEDKKTNEKAVRKNVNDRLIWIKGIQMACVLSLCFCKLEVSFKYIVLKSSLLSSYVLYTFFGVFIITYSFWKKNQTVPWVNKINFMMFLKKSLTRNQKKLKLRGKLNIWKTKHRSIYKSMSLDLIRGKKLKHNIEKAKV